MSLFRGNEAVALSNQCQTKFGCSLEKVLGSTEEVYKFDRVRRQLKKGLTEYVFLCGGIITN